MDELPGWAMSAVASYCAVYPDDPLVIEFERLMAELHAMIEGLSDGAA